MPEYQVLLTETARKDLSDFPEHDIDHILEACLRLETDPHPDGKHIKKLKGYKQLYRLRIGDYRAVFEWKSNTVTVLPIF